MGGVKCGCHLEPLSRPAVGTAARPVSAPDGGIGGSGGGGNIQGKEEKPEGFGKVICFPEKIV